MRTNGSTALVYSRPLFLVGGRVRKQALLRGARVSRRGRQDRTRCSSDDAFGVFGTTVPEKIGVVHSSSLQWCRYLQTHRIGDEVHSLAGRSTRLAHPLRGDDILLGHLNNLTSLVLEYSTQPRWR